MNQIKTKSTLLLTCGLALFALPCAFAEHKGEHSAAMFKAMDTNGDGQVSQAEHAASADAMFTKLDVDGDGFLSASECAKGHDGMMQDKHSS